MSKRTKIQESLGALCISALLGGSQAMMIAQAMNLSVSPAAVCLLCVAVAALMSLAMVSRPCAIVAGGLALAAGCMWALSSAKPLSQLGALIRAMMDFSSGGQFMLTEHAAAIALSLAMLLTLVMHWMTRMSGGAYPALTLSIIIMMGGWLVNKTLSGLYVVPMLAALAAMFARSSDDKLPYLRALPAGLMAAVLAFMLLPAGNPTWEPLRESAERVRQMFYNYFLFTDTRVTYSLYPDGFQPQGEALGGPADPSDHQVMRVESDNALLLRGAIKRTYTTYSWTNSAINNRYLFVDPTKRGVRDQIFDSARLDNLDAGGAFERVSADVTMLSEGISTLFVPHRLRDLSGGSDYAIYYNSSGEVFITRGVQPGDSYSFAALAPTGSTAAMERLLSQAETLSDDGYAAVLQDYTALPRGIESGVYDLVARVTEGAGTPYQKALRIQAHLMGEYEYSLDVPYPPRNRDFVSYFLLSGKQGYCSYFASAMAVMARIAGLPARYIEGYMVPAGVANGQVVTGRNAHAWVEIYFKGVGWVTFNPTPGDGESGGGPGGQSGSGEPAPDGESEGDPSEDGQQDEQQDDPAQDDPAEDDHTEDGQTDEDQADPDQGDDDGMGADNPEGDDQRDPESPDESPDGGQDEGADAAGEPQSRSLWWLVLLLALALLSGAGALVIRRLRASDPAVLAKATADPAQRLIIWYRALLLLLEQQGQAPAAGESPEQFALRLREAGLVNDAMVYVAKQLTRNRYARVKPESQVFKQAALSYQRQAKSLKPFERISWYRRRIIGGLGDMDRVP